MTEKQSIFIFKIWEFLKADEIYKRVFNNGKNKKIMRDSIIQKLMLVLIFNLYIS